MEKCSGARLPHKIGQVFKMKAAPYACLCFSLQLSAAWTFPLLSLQGFHWLPLSERRLRRFSIAFCLMVPLKKKQPKMRINRLQVCSCFFFLSQTVIRAVSSVCCDVFLSLSNIFKKWLACSLMLTSLCRLEEPKIFLECSRLPSHVRSGWLLGGCGGLCGGGGDALI